MRVSMNRWLAVAAAAALILGPARGRVLGIPIKMRPLPGSGLSIDKAIEEEAPFAAVCEAVGRFSESSTPVAPGGAAWGRQEFKVVEVLFGGTKPVDRIDIAYRLTGRPIGSHERVIWIGHTRKMSSHGRLYGLKALPDTPQNRQAVKAAAAQASTAWGEAVEGVQVRLRAKQSTWKEGTAVRLWADVRNQGKRNLFIRLGQGQYDRCELEVDGRWYRRPRILNRPLPPKPFPPGRQYDNIGVDLSGQWELAASRIARSPWESGRGKPRLAPGKHTIRVAFTATAARKPPLNPVRAVSNPVEIEIVASSDEKVDATQQANASVTAAEPKLDGKETLDKLKSIDAVYAAAFTASGNRSGWPKTKWKLTMLDGEILYEEQVVEVPKPAKGRIGQFIPFRSTLYLGPTAQAGHDWVGRIRRYGPLDPWPENSPGPATYGNLKVVRPDALTYTLLINRPILCLGRGYSKYITDIKEVVEQEDGRLKITADGVDFGSNAPATWELVVDPDAAYMVRSARVVDNDKKYVSSFANSGVKKYDARCVPEKAECKGGFINASFEIQSASPEADIEFLRLAKAAMQPPYAVFTDVSDERRTPRLYLPYDAGKASSPNGNLDLDLGGEKEAASDTKREPAGGPTAEATDLKPDEQAPAAEAAWGEAVEGLQVRLRAKQSKWNEGTVPRLSADVRNQGKRILLVGTQSRGWELEVDGRWYRQPVRRSRGITGPPRPLPPGRGYDDIAVDLGRSWQLAASRIARSPWGSGRGRLELTPGKHTIRVAFTAWVSKKARAPIYAPGNDFRAVTNPIEIEIVAKSDQEGDATQQGDPSATSAVPPIEATDAKPDDPTTAVPPVEPSLKSERPDGDTDLEKEAVFDMEEVVPASEPKLRDVIPPNSNQAVARKGEIEIGGRQYTALLARVGTNTESFHRPDTLLLLTPGTNPKHSYDKLLGATRMVDGKYYKISATPTGDKLTVTPCGDNVGVLRVGAGGRDVEKREVIHGFLLPKEGLVPLGNFSSPAPADDPGQGRIPVGDYAFDYLRLDFGTVRLFLRRNGPRAYNIKIRKDRPFTLNFSAKGNLLLTSPTPTQTFKPGSSVPLVARIVDPELNLHVIAWDREGFLEPTVVIRDASGKQVAASRMPFC